MLSSTESSTPADARLSVQDVRDRMRLEYERCLDAGQAVAVIALEPIGLRRMEREHPGCAPAVMRALLGVVRDAAHGRVGLAYASSGALVALLPDTTPEVVDSICKRVLEEVRSLPIEDIAAAQRVRLGVGLAHSSTMERLFETLLLVAEEGVAVASNRGGGCAVHTMLYDILQARAKRMRDEGGHALPRPDDVVFASAPRPAPAPLTPPTEEPTGDAAPPRESALELLSERARSTIMAARRELAERNVDHSEEKVDRLERRIAKLLGAVDEMERQLVRSRSGGETRDGVSSAYRSAQGLPPGERDYDLKMSLLRAILDANLELQGSAAGGARFAEPASISG